MKEIRLKLLLAAGTASAAIGIIGIFLPILPTTPFLLLSAFCYSRSSKNFYRWLMENRICGQYITNYVKGKGVPLKQKLYTAFLLWASIMYGVIFVAESSWIRLLLIFIAVAVTTHLVMIRTYRP